MIHHRTWLEWICMHWVIGVKVEISDRNEIMMKYESTRFCIFAFLHMLIIKRRIEKLYPGVRIITWLDWKL